MDIDDAATESTTSDSDDTAQSDTPNTADTPEAPDELTLAREPVLRAHPDVIHELVSGNSLAELLASIPAAEAAFARVVAATQSAASREAATALVPGGGAVRSTSVNVDGLGPLAKIRAGLGQS